MLEGKWSKYVWPATEAAEHDPDTGVKREDLVEVAKASVTLPDDFVSPDDTICPGALLMISMFTRG